jgi:hypothetical protein
VEGEEASQVPVCKAFPDQGIPPDIAFGGNLHLEIHILQNNTIIFEKKA